MVHAELATHASLAVAPSFVLYVDDDVVLSTCNVTTNSVVDSTDAAATTALKYAEKVAILSMTLQAHEEKIIELSVILSLSMTLHILTIS